MKYTEKLKNKGFETKIRKECEDGEGYDLYLTVSKGDSFLLTPQFRNSHIKFVHDQYPNHNRHHDNQYYLM